MNAEDCIEEEKTELQNVKSFTRTEEKPRWTFNPIRNAFTKFQSRLLHRNVQKFKSMTNQPTYGWTDWHG